MKVVVSIKRYTDMLLGGRSGMNSCRHILNTTDTGLSTYFLFIFFTKNLKLNIYRVCLENCPQFVT